MYILILNLWIYKWNIFRWRSTMLHWIRSNSAVAISAGALNWQNMSGFHLVDRRRLGIQIDRSGRGCSPLGYSQEQTQNELREVEPRLTLLLWQKHYT